MIGNKRLEGKILYCVSLEDLVPEDNFYRQIDRFLDLRFLYKECKGLYGTTGKPSIDPVVFFKLLLFGYFENIISDRELVRRASDSLGVRLYLGYDIDEELPWHSTISRTRKLYKEEIFEKLFDKVLEKCISAGIVSGEHQSIDSTLVRANASLSSLEKKIDIVELKEYINRTSKENSVEEKSEKKKSDDGEGKGGSKSQTRNQEYVSKTDPDSRMARKGDKPTNMYYSTHYGVDSKRKVITDVLTTHADMGDSTSLMTVVNRLKTRLSINQKEVKQVSADKGYYSGKNLKKLEDEGIIPYIPKQRNVNTNGGIDKEEFKYDAQSDTYQCPEQKQLGYSHTRKEKESRVYKTKFGECTQCPIKERCTTSKSRSINRSIYHDEIERLDQRMKSREGKNAMRLRKTGPEPLFGEAKANHGLSKFMNRGISNAQKTSYVIATVQNLKRLMKVIAKKREVISKELENLILTVINPVNNYYKLTLW
jgi:transposase